MKKTMYTCETCKTKKLSINEIVKTDDNKELCHQCYREIAAELKSGVFTKEEANTTYNFMRAYEKRVRQLVRIITIESRKKGLSGSQSATEAAKVEDLLAQEMFNKKRVCLNKMEHGIIIDMAQDILYGTIRKEQNIHEIISKGVLDNYLVGLTSY